MHGNHRLLPMNDYHYINGVVIYISSSVYKSVVHMWRYAICKFPEFYKMYQRGGKLTHWSRDKMAAIFPDIIKYIFLNKNIWISITISLIFVSNGSM